eukprot:718851-Alexandrium_andersonii.AAC.1
MEPCAQPAYLALPPEIPRISPADQPPRSGHGGLCPLRCGAPLGAGWSSRGEPGWRLAEAAHGRIGRHGRAATGRRAADGRWRARR